jgi:hypothetical protein
VAGHFLKGRDTTEELVRKDTEGPVVDTLRVLAERMGLVSGRNKAKEAEEGETLTGPQPSQVGDSRAFHRAWCA